MKIWKKHLLLLATNWDRSMKVWCTVLYWIKWGYISATGQYHKTMRKYSPGINNPFPEMYTCEMGTMIMTLALYRWSLKIAVTAQLPDIQGIICIHCTRFKVFCKWHTRKLGQKARCQRFASDFLINNSTIVEAMCFSKAATRRLRGSIFHTPLTWIC